MIKINKTLIVGINLGDYGSTGTIMRNTLEYASEHGNFDYLVIVPKNEGKPNVFPFYKDFCRIKSFFYNRIIKIRKKYPDGFFYKEFSKKVVKEIKINKKKYNQVFVHFHNLHMMYIDFRVIFKYISHQKDIRCFYTIHDAWPFTGGCYCFNYLKCFKWQNGCNGKCPQIEYARGTFQPNIIFKQKRLFSLLLRHQMTLIPVSNWMKYNLEKSFFKDFDIILNPGECSISKLPYKDSQLAKDLNVDGKKVCLSISGYWNDWKGIKYLLELSKYLPNNYVLLLVGGEINFSLPKNIIHVPFVENDLLNHYFSISDVFVSTTQDDNLPLVLMEAQICGIPIVGFGHGGTKEEIIEGKTGYMVGTDNNVKKLAEKIIFTIEEHPFKEEDILKKGQEYAKYSHAKRQFNIYLKYLIK